SGGGSADIPVTTFYPIDVNILDANFLRATDLNVRLSILHPRLDELRIELVAPDGTTRFPLLLNHTNPDGTTNPNTGIPAGVDLGTAPDGPPGTTFDDQGSRFISDTAVTSLWTGHYRPEILHLTDAVLTPDPLLGPHVFPPTALQSFRGRGPYSSGGLN